MSKIKILMHITFLLSCGILLSACTQDKESYTSEEATASPIVEEGSTSIDISRATLKDMESTNRLLLDVRTPEEYQDGFIMDAINIPVDQLPEQLDNLASMSSSKSHPIVIYCRTGKRAQKAIDFLSSQGYTNLLHLEGDFGGWETANEEVSIQTN